MIRQHLCACVTRCAWANSERERDCLRVHSEEELITLASLIPCTTFLSVCIANFEFQDSNAKKTFAKMFG